ncbi:glycosyltransferase [Neobacillus sp. 19]|uniref:glycosyltransferase n=1 Tax=Neobacillus sp. 19 TaxID=3394458 RepID=UPI003BF715D5
MDFLTISPERGYYDNEILNSSGNLYRVKASTPKWKYFSWIKIKIRLLMLYINILRGNKYQALHVHGTGGTGLLFLFIGKLYRVNVRIIHNHGIPESYKPTLLNSIVRYIKKLSTDIISTHKLGCSKKICEFYFGKNCFNDSRTAVIRNGIDLEKFSNVYKKGYVKTKYSIPEEKYNFIHVGRFSKEKNQIFLIRMFAELCKLRSDVHLTIIGYGLLEKEIKEEIHIKGIDRNISFLPQDSFIPEVMSAMNFFVLPSLNEGLGIVLIEAQAMGLPCFVSSAVPNEADLGMCMYYPLNKGEKYWANVINESIDKKSYKSSIDNKKLSMFDIRSTASIMAKIYCEET